MPFGKVFLFLETRRVISWDSEGVSLQDTAGFFLWTLKYLLVFTGLNLKIISSQENIVDYIFWGTMHFSNDIVPTVKLSNKLRVYIDFNLPSAAFIIFSILIETQWFCRDFAWSPCCWFPPTDMLVRWTRYFNLPVGVNVTVNVFVCLYCVCALWQIGSLWGCTPLHAQCMLGQAPRFPLIRIHLENGELTIKRVGHLCIYT